MFLIDAIDEPLLTRPEACKGLRALTRSPQTCASSFVSLLSGDQCKAKGAVIFPVLLHRYPTQTSRVSVSPVTVAVIRFGSE